MDLEIVFDLVCRSLIYLLQKKLVKIWEISVVGSIARDM